MRVVTHATFGLAAPKYAGEDDRKGKFQEAGKAIEDPSLSPLSTESRTVRQVLLNWVKPTQESILGDLNGKDVNTAISLARDRIEWKKLRPSNRC